MRQRLRFAIIFLLSFAMSVETTLWPYLFRFLVDAFTKYDAMRTSAWPTLMWLFFYLLLLWGFVEISFRVRDFLRAHAYPQLEADIRMEMFDHVQHHSPRYFSEHFAGNLSNKISDMAMQVTQIVDKLLFLLPILGASVIAIILFFEISALFAWMLISFILAYYAVIFFFAPLCAKAAQAHGEARSTLAGEIVDSLTNNFSVNLFFRFRFEKWRASSYQEVEKGKNTKARLYVARMFLADSFVFFFSMVALLGLMFSQWMKNALSTGQVVQIFNTYLNISFLLWLAGMEMPEFLQSLGIAKQAHSLVKDPQDVVDAPGATPLHVTKGEIIFENVTFHYGKKTLFKNKSIHIKAGEKVGLVGYSGAGKSTFVNLILRFYPVESGRILVDGQDISSVTLESLRTHIALIPQDPILFHRSLEENIAYGRVDASTKDVVAAAKLAHCDDFIQKQPEGYATMIGERGTKLSGGERQRIAIARAFLAAPPILILDEATSALDSVTENIIQESFERLFQQRTILVVAHRLSTLAKMDRILVFDQGKIVEQGPHDKLLSNKGHYARMWKMQAGGFLPDQPMD